MGLAILSTVVLTIHLLLVNLAMTAPLVCVWLEWRESRYADTLAGEVGRRLARLAIWSLLSGIVQGGLLLLFRGLRDGDAYLNALLDVPHSRLWFGASELVFYFACLGLYLGMWRRSIRWRFLRRLLAVAGATNLLMHFPALFSIVSLLTTRAELVGRELTRAEYRALLVDPEVLARVAHLWLAAFALAGVVLMAVVGRSTAEEEPTPERGLLIKRGAMLALATTMLQIPVGIWLALELPAEAREPLMGTDWLAASLFLASLLLVMQLMHTLIAIALGEQQRTQLRKALAMIVLLTLLMVATRSRLRTYSVTVGGAQTAISLSVSNAGANLLLPSQAIAVQ